jgi:hypothetical protein
MRLGKEYLIMHLLERDTCLEELGSALHDAAGGEGRVVLVTRQWCRRDEGNTLPWHDSVAMARLL